MPVSGHTLFYKSLSHSFWLLAVNDMNHRGHRENINQPLRVTSQIRLPAQSSDQS